MDTLYFTCFCMGYRGWLYLWTRLALVSLDLTTRDDLLLYSKFAKYNIYVQVLWCRDFYFEVLCTYFLFYRINPNTLKPHLFTLFIELICFWANTAISVLNLPRDIKYCMWCFYSHERCGANLVSSSTKVFNLVSLHSSKSTLLLLLVG